jgi:ABC-type Fe3+/spermidine/putrescine transport system ATPase subunit
LSNLDAVLRKEMRAQLKSLQRRLATSVLYVTHDQEEAMSLSNRIVVMNGGRVEQIAVPGVVYEKPATRFVQDFVGRTIRLRGSVTDAGGSTRVQVGGGAFEIGRDASAPLADGQQVEVSLRPEDVVMHSDGAPGTNAVAARIVEVTYYGDRLECTVCIDGPEEQLVVVTADKRKPVREGDRVFLAVDPSLVMVWRS